LKRAVLAAAFVVSVVLPFSARAEDVPRNVEVTIIGGGTEEAALEATVKELLDRVQLSSIHAPAAAYVPLLSRVTIDLSNPKVARVSVVDARDGRVLMKRDLVRDPNPSVAREEIAHAVQSAVEAELLKRTDASPPPAASPSPSPPPSPPASALAPAPASPPASAPAIADSTPPKPTSPSSVTLDIAVFAAAGPIAKSSGVAPRVGGGVVVGLASSSLRPSLALLGSYAPPFETGDDVIRARTSFGSARAIPAIEIFRTPSIALDWGLGGGFDVLTVAPQSNVLPSSRLGSSTSSVDVIATSLLTLRADVVPSVFFFASAGVEVNALTRPYVARRGPENEEVFAPWSVRPMIALGFAFTAVGRR
jgi:hypothetical protein